MALLESALARVVAAVLSVLSTLGSTAPVAGAQNTAPESYVAMGDSYTAGPGILFQRAVPVGCFRSDHNYPQLVARERGSVLRDVSCSGAETDDLFSAQDVFGGPNPPQLAAVDADVDVVTVQIGGNDIGFSQILERCAAPLPLGTPCQNAYVVGGVDELGRRIAATAPKVAAALAEIRRRSPDAEVFVIGYPAILPEVQPGCWPLMPITPGDVPYLRDTEKRLNAMLATEAAAAGATYVDVYGPSIGHDACQLPGVRWVEPMIPVPPVAPVHPNGLGMERMAASVAAAMAG